MKSFIKRHTLRPAIATLSALSIICSTAVAQDTQIEEDANQELPSAYNTSYVPIIAYEGTYGLILGVAYFLYPNKASQSPGNQEFDVLLYAADGPVASIETRWKQNDFAQNIDLEIFTDASNFFVKDYPNAQYEGILIDRNFAKFNPKFTQGISDTHNFTYEFTLDYKDFGQNAPESFKEGVSLSAGLGYLIDERENGNNSKEGYMLQSTFNVKPHFLSTTEDGTFSTKLELDARYYYSFTQSQSFATRGLFQYATGNLLDARFGGSKIMRGFSSNRFIGQQAFTLQNEYRYQINKHFSTVGFLSIGQIDTQDNVLVNYGVGLRVGLPPDQTQQIRVDFGFDTDNNLNFMLQFNQAI